MRKLYTPLLLYAVFSLAAFFALAALVSGSPGAEAGIGAYDARVTGLLSEIRVPSIIMAMLFITQFGRGEVVIFGLLGAAAFFWYAHRRRSAFLLTVSVGLGGALLGLLKIVIGRARPSDVYALFAEHGFSFPSGHAFIAVVFYGLLAYLLLQTNAFRGRIRRVVAWGGAGLAMTIAFSRLYLGVHWASDVIGGVLLGTAWLALCCFVYQAYPDPEHDVRRRKHFLPHAVYIFLSIWMVGVWYFFATHPI